MHSILVGILITSNDLVMGVAGDFPEELIFPKDRKAFQNITKGSTLWAGPKTFEEVSHMELVKTKRKLVEVRHDTDIELARGMNFLIGGAHTLKERVDEMHGFIIVKAKNINLAGTPGALSVPHPSEDFPEMIAQFSTDEDLTAELWIRSLDQIRSFVNLAEKMRKGYA